MLKIEDDLIDRMSFDEFMEFCEWTCRQIENKTCRELPARSDGYLAKLSGANNPHGIMCLRRYFVLAKKGGKIEED